jgi:hypothetical protein
LILADKYNGCISDIDEIADKYNGSISAKDIDILLASCNKTYQGYMDYREISFLKVKGILWA